MDETQFIRGIEGEKQQQADLVSGAEHLVRLKIQTGYEKEQYPDLEIEKQASLESQARGFAEGAARTIKNTAHTVKQTATGGFPAYYAGKLAPGAAAMGGAYAVGKHRGKEKYQYHPDPYSEPYQEKQATESITPALNCKNCGKVKSACMCGTKMASAQQLKLLLKEKLANSDWNKAMLTATTGLGALVGAGGTYLASRPQEDTGKGKAEEELEAAVSANKGKPERGLLEKLKNRETENAHGFAKAFREHPGKAAILGGLTGALGGYQLGRLGGAISKRGK